MDWFVLGQAAEVVKEAPAWWHSVDFVNVCIGAATLIFGFFFKLVRDRYIKDEKLKAGLAALEAGVLAAVDMYKSMKKDSGGDKLTDAQKKALRDFAFSKAIEVAKGPAKDWLLEQGQALIRAWIEKLVNKNKKEGAEARGKLTGGSEDVGGAG
jgi:hypothetical protein